MDALAILREAVKAVPSVKYALAVAGILAAASIGMRLANNDWKTALIGAICTILLMVIMVVFARLSTTAAATFKGPVLVLTWFSVLLLMFWATALTSSVFAGWPKFPWTTPIPLDDRMGACTLAPSQSSDTVREATAGDVLDLVKKVASWKRQAEFEQLFKNKYIPLGGWTGTVEGLPEVNKGSCNFMVVEDRTAARVQVSTCQKPCDFRGGDRVKLSGWLKQYDVDQLEIVANKIDEPHGPTPAASPREVFVVCHGEYEAKCKAHPYTNFEHCGDDNGVGGANGNVSGRNLCKNENFDVLPAEGGSIDGNHCGYSWFKIACK